MAAAKPLPRTLFIRSALLFLIVFYAGLGGTGIYYYQLGGKSWDGDTNTLTSVLAAFGAIFTATSRLLLAQCQDAGLQYLAKKAMDGSVSLHSLHEMDMAVRGSIRSALASWPGWLYRVILPVLAILTSAIFKKALGTELRSTSVTVTGNDASFVDPISVGSGIRGALFAGAILYNITTSIGSGMNPAQQSWTYLAADTIDLSGLQSMQYFMPSLPALVAAGSSGYTSYSASSVPALVSRVQCSATTYNILNQFGSIVNSNNEITLGYISQSTAIIQVSTKASTSWSCLAYLGQTTGIVEYISDSSGNWNISSTNMSTVTSLDFTTTDARGFMMADIISDALGTTAGYSNWNWDTSTSNSVGYAMMLISTRLSFAAALAAYSDVRAKTGPPDVSGQANQPVQKITLHASWALITTSIFFLLQAVFAFFFIWPFGKLRIDFGILQIMEMRSSVVTLNAPEQDLGVSLLGHCSQIRTDNIAIPGEVAIRAKGQHLGFLSFANMNNVQWNRVNSTATYL